MEVGIPQSLSALEKSFLPTSRLSLESNVLDVKLASSSQFNDKDDEGEIMLLAMILLQLHGVSKLPVATITTTTTTVTTSTSSNSEEESDLSNKKKRQRTSPDQLAILEQIFQTDKMPNPQTRGQLADQLGMSSRRVQIWFQNKRAKVKRGSMKQDEECDSPSSINLSDSSSSIPPPSPESPSLSSSPQSPSTSQTPTTQAATTITNATTSPAPSSSKSTPSLTVFTSSTTSTTTAASSNDTILADTTKQLKAQQQQFSLKAPFVENKPLLAASY